MSNSFELVEALVDVLFKFATLLVLALAIEPNASLTDVRAFLVLVGVLDELARRKDPNFVVALVVKNEVVVLAKFVRDRGEERAVARLDVLRACFDLNLNELIVAGFDDCVYGVVIDEWQVHVHALLEHEAYHPILNAFAETGGVTKWDAHVKWPNAQGKRRRKERSD